MNWFRHVYVAAVVGSALEFYDFLAYPAAIRSGSLAVIYVVSIALFGGTTHYSITWLLRATGNPLAPAWYWTAALAVGIAALCATREPAPRKIVKPNDWTASELEVS